MLCWFFFPLCVCTVPTTVGFLSQRTRTFSCCMNKPITERMIETCIRIIPHFSDNEIENSKNKLNYLGWVTGQVFWTGFFVYSFLCVVYVPVNKSQLKVLRRKGKRNCWETSGQLLRWIFKYSGTKTSHWSGLNEFNTLDLSISEVRSLPAF